MGTFAARMTMNGVRKQLKQILVHALVALMIKSECPNVDIREVPMTLSIVHNSTEKLGIADTVFSESVKYAT